MRDFWFRALVICGGLSPVAIIIIALIWKR